MSSLVLKTLVTRNAAGDQLYIEFLNATGAYNVSTNPGGFGTPNPSRNSLAIIFYGNFTKVAGNVLAMPSVNDPLTVTSFTIPLTIDVNGILNYYVFALPIYSGSNSYSAGDVTYDNSNPAAPFIKKYDGTTWTTIHAADLVGTSVDQKTGNALVIPDAERFRNTLNASKVEKLRAYIKKLCGHDEYIAVRNQFDFVDGLLEEATNDVCAGAPNEAQIKIEEILAFQQQLNG